MTITERLEQKHSEYSKVNEEQERLWAIVKEKESAYKKAINPWSDVYNIASKLKNEIEALEIAKEFEAK